MTRRVVRLLVVCAVLLTVLPASAQAGSPAPPPQPVAGSLDFLFAFDPHTGKWHIHQSGHPDHTFYFGIPGDTPLFGDWNGDGFDTPAMYRQSTGYVYLTNKIMSEGTGVGEHTFYFGAPGDIPIAGDFDGDGKDTISVYRPSTGQVHITNTLPPNGGALVAEHSYYFGNPGDKPFAGDFDGDGKDTVGLHRESTGIVYFRNSHTTGTADNEFYFGLPGDRLVAGDWAQGGPLGPPDGIDTPAVFRPSTSTWYFRFENTQGFADRIIQWGLPHWIPLVGNIGLG